MTAVAWTVAYCVASYIAMLLFLAKTWPEPTDGITRCAGGFLLLVAPLTAPLAITLALSYAVGLAVEKTAEYLR